MEAVVKNLTQVQSDLIWFAKGWWVLYDQTFAEGSDLQQLQIMANRYYGASNPNVPRTLQEELTDLVGVAIMDCTYPNREFAEFFTYWEALVKKKFTDKLINEFELEKLQTEAMLVILMRWNLEDENYKLCPPSWPLPKKKEKK